MAKRILMVYPHNFFDRNSGINARFYQWAVYFRSRNYAIDLFALDNFESDWGAGTFNRDEALIDELILYDHRRGVIERPGGVLRRALMGAMGRPRHPALPDYAFPTMQRVFQRLVRSKSYDFVFFGYAYWANLLRAGVPAGTRTVLEVSDFLTLNLFETTGGAVNIGEALGDEIRRVDMFQEVICISEEEQRFFSQFARTPRYTYVPYFLEQPARTFGQEVYDILFIASGNPHNVQAAAWFFGEVYPHLSAGLRILVVGKICAQVPDLPNLTKVAFVADLGEAYGAARVCVCPLRSGTGMKIKVVEALAYGKPLVTTSKGLVGIPCSIHDRFLVCDEPLEFARQVNRAVEDKAWRAVQAEGSAALFREHFSIDAAYQKLDPMFAPEMVEAGLVELL